MFIVLVIAWLYERYGTRPAAVELSAGIVPVIVAIVAQAVVGLGRTAIKDVLLGVLAVAAAVAWLVGINELVLLAAGAAVGALWRNRHLVGRNAAAWLLLPVATSGAAAADPTLARLGLVFLKIGAVLYGSGYVLISFMESDLVERYGWLTERQLLDAVAVGQVTPGPVFTTATFVGYQIAGFAGAAVATAAIFAPAFVFVALLSRITPSDPPLHLGSRRTRRCRRGLARSDGRGGRPPRRQRRSPMRWPSPPASSRWSSCSASDRTPSGSSPVARSSASAGSSSADPSPHPPPVPPEVDLCRVERSGGVSSTQLPHPAGVQRFVGVCRDRRT